MNSALFKRPLLTVAVFTASIAFAGGALLYCQSWVAYTPIVYANERGLIEDPSLRSPQHCAALVQVVTSYGDEATLDEHGQARIRRWFSWDRDYLWNMTTKAEDLVRSQAAKSPRNQSSGDIP